MKAQYVLDLCASICSAHLDQKHVVADFLMCIDEAIHAFHGLFNNQLNGSDFKHKRMHIIEFGQTAIHVSSARTHTHSLSLFLTSVPPPLLTPKFQCAS